MKATIRELRASTKEILTAVSRGDTVLVTSRGEPCAKIVPVSFRSKPGTVFERKKPAGRDPLFGIWRNKAKTGSVKNYVKKLRKVRYAR